MNKGRAKGSVKEKTTKFSELCGLICPNFLKKHKKQAPPVARALYDAHHVLDDLLEQAYQFKERHPKGIEIKGDMPRDNPSTSHNKDVWSYKEQASNFIRKTIKLDITADIAIPRTFYSEIIKYCIKKK
jgi:hypothetical protein